MKKETPKTLTLNNPDKDDIKRINKIKKYVNVRNNSDALRNALVYAETYIRDEQRIKL